MHAFFDSPAPLLPEILALHSKWRGQRDALVADGEVLSWAEFGASLNRFANALLASGVQPGDKVVVLMSNGIPMAQALFGIMAAGCVSVPINLSVSADGLQSMLSDAGATAVVATDDQRSRLQAACEASAAELKVSLCVNESAPGWTNWERFHSGHEATPPEVNVQPDDELNIIYSSGTTGQPKGIVHSHRGRRDWAYDLAIALRYHGSARTLLTIGLYSNISWVAMLCTLLAGGTLVIASRFDARDFLCTVKDQGITHTAMVPVQFQRVLELLQEEPGRFDVSSMHAMMSCGSPLHEQLKRDIFQLFPCGIIELYGLTEGIITTLEPEDAHARWNSVGKPLLGTDIAIIGDDNRPLPAGQEGEIVSRGRISMPGYHKRPEANRESTWTDPEGRRWLRSGDIGRLDEQGFLYIVDRKKDMILSGGQNVYPQDIEAVLIQSPEVRDVAVIAASSRRWGETPLALVVPAAATAQSNSVEIRDWANERLGRQQRVSDIIFVEDLPRNPNGKILKRELRQQYANRQYD